MCLVLLCLYQAQGSVGREAVWQLTDKAKDGAGFYLNGKLKSHLKQKEKASWRTTCWTTPTAACNGDKCSYGSWNIIHRNIDDCHEI
jgi:hypothetical protein